MFFQLDPNEFNNTKNAEKDVLYFNRVPKVGSEMLMALLETLSVKNNFSYNNLQDAVAVPEGEKVGAEDRTSGQPEE